MASQVLSGLQKLEMENMAGRSLEIDNPVGLYALQFFPSLLNAWHPTANTIKAVLSLAFVSKGEAIVEQSLISLHTRSFDEKNRFMLVDSHIKRRIDRNESTCLLKSGKIWVFFLKKAFGYILLLC